MNHSSRPALVSRLFAPDGTPRDRTLWLVFAGIVASQVLSLFVVCQHQVQRAEARHAEELRQSAVLDCAGTAAGPRSCGDQTADATSTRMGSAAH